MKNNKTWKMLLIILMVIVVAVIIGITMYNNSDAVRLRKQLDLGQKYLSEMNYEKAVMAFNQAIEIDPRSADAYLGLADAYLGLGDKEAALAALEAGYEATGDERLKERIDEMKVVEDSENVLEVVKDDEEIVERIFEIHKFIQEETTIGWLASTDEYHYLTYDQIEMAYRPLAEELEMYLEQVHGEWEVYAWRDLENLYCYLGEMEKCLETHRKGCEAEGLESLKLYYNDNYLFDEYGRHVGYGDGDTITYGEGYRALTWDNPHISNHSEYEYDSLGRISRIQVSSTNTSEYSYEYQSDNSVVITVVTVWDNGDETSGTCTITYNEYGFIVDRTEWQPATEKYR